MIQFHGNLSEQEVDDIKRRFLDSYRSGSYAVLPRGAEYTYVYSADSPEPVRTFEDGADVTPVRDPTPEELRKEGDDTWLRLMGNNP